ncbi:MAG TPA: glycerate kinase [Solirubrobacteraceae bacterium]|jgi:glycerate kinase|nr:glycerate kinase [Solirubrobacteraceae bacterium]
MQTAASQRDRLPVGISLTVLLAAQDLGPRLSAQVAAEAVGVGLTETGRLRADSYSLSSELSEDFDAQMKAARAVVIIAPRLDEQTLLGSLPFEIATRARQSGVPAYAITRENELSAFDARILDLQLVIQARSARSLTQAGVRLAEVI